jgi:hypothetical protein
MIRQLSHIGTMLRFVALSTVPRGRVQFLSNQFEKSVSSCLEMVDPLEVKLLNRVEEPQSSD